MKRWRSHAVIVTYLSVLFAGVGAHALQYKEHDHPLMYYIVWDMFCGWTAWETRLHILAEGESGTVYDLAPGPWGDYHPYSNIPRHHYDPYVAHAQRIAMNTLQHSRHEPIRRILVCEEAWQKKYNLPESLAETLVPPPTDPQSIILLRDVYSPDGTVIHRGKSFFERMHKYYTGQNERLQQQMQPPAPGTFTVSQARSFESYSNSLQPTAQ